MNNGHWLSKIFKTIGLTLTLGVSMSACASGGKANWKEEVLLHNGEKLIVERSQTYVNGSAPGSREWPLVEEVWEFTIPATQQRIIWKSDWGRANQDNLNLLILDFLGSTPYVATSTWLCHAYNKWKRPNPPYIFFKFDGKVWQQIPLNEFPAEFINVNVFVGRPALEDRTGTLSIAKIKEKTRSLEQPYQRTILRTPLTPREATILGCPLTYSGFKAPFPITPPNNTGVDKK